jgi:hypothetical protein
MTNLFRKPSRWTESEMFRTSLAYSEDPSVHSPPTLTPVATDVNIFSFRTCSAVNDDIHAHRRYSDEGFSHPTYTSNFDTGSSVQEPSATGSSNQITRVFSLLSHSYTSSGSTEAFQQLNSSQQPTHAGYSERRVTSSNETFPRASSAALPMKMSISSPQLTVTNNVELGVSALRRSGSYSPTSAYKNKGEESFKSILWHDTHGGNHREHNMVEMGARSRPPLDGVVPRSKSSPVSSTDRHKYPRMAMQRNLQAINQGNKNWLTDDIPREQGTKKVPPALGMWHRSDQNADRTQPKSPASRRTLEIQVTDGYRDKDVLRMTGKEIHENDSPSGMTKSDLASDSSMSAAGALLTKEHIFHTEDSAQSTRGCGMLSGTSEVLNGSAVAVAGAGVFAHDSARFEKRDHGKDRNSSACEGSSAQDGNSEAGSAIQQTIPIGQKSSAHGGDMQNSKSEAGSILQQPDNVYGTRQEEGRAHDSKQRDSNTTVNAPPQAETVGGGAENYTRSQAHENSQTSAVCSPARAEDGAVFSSASLAKIQSCTSSLSEFSGNGALSSYSASAPALYMSSALTSQPEASSISPILSPFKEQKLLKPSPTRTAAVQNKHDIADSFASNVRTPTGDSESNSDILSRVQSSEEGPLQHANHPCLFPQAHMSTTVGTENIYRRPTYVQDQRVQDSDSEQTNLPLESFCNVSPPDKSVNDVLSDECIHAPGAGPGGALPVKRLYDQGNYSPLQALDELTCLEPDTGASDEEGRETVVRRVSQPSPLVKGGMSPASQAAWRYRGTSPVYGGMSPMNAATQAAYKSRGMVKGSMSPINAAVQSWQNPQETSDVGGGGYNVGHAHAMMRQRRSVSFGLFPEQALSLLKEEDHVENGKVENNGETHETNRGTSGGKHEAVVHNDDDDAQNHAGTQISATHNLTRDRLSDFQMPIRPEEASLADSDSASQSSAQCYYSPIAAYSRSDSAGTFEDREPRNGDQEVQEGGCASSSSRHFRNKRRAMLQRTWSITSSTRSLRTSTYTAENNPITASRHEAHLGPDQSLGMLELFLKQYLNTTLGIGGFMNRRMKKLK